MLRKDILYVIVDLQQTLRSLEQLNMAYLKIKQLLIGHEWHSWQGQDIFNCDLLFFSRLLCFDYR